MKKEKKEKKDNTLCDKSMTFQDCELAILRSAVDLAESKQGNLIVNTPEVQEMISTVETFLKRKDLICYGGVAIDALLPDEDKIYNKNVEMSDYDCYSPNALDDAKELADIFSNQGYTEVEAKAGVHHGTFKVYCNFIGVADITLMPKELFDTVKKTSVRVSGILYCPPNFLKMSMYVELSRPEGQLDRFEKVFKRLTLLNKHYPLTTTSCPSEYQRKMSNPTNEDIIFDNVRTTLINQGVVFLGGYAITLYSHYMSKRRLTSFKKIADFDVLSLDPESTAEIIKERLSDDNVKNVKIIKHDPLWEIIPEHYEVKIGNDTIAFIYKPISCHSYNVLKLGNKRVRVATIDTMLSFMLAFLYADRPYYNEFSERIICMAQLLFDVQQKNRLAQKGILRRFSIECYGHHDTVSEMRASKNDMFKKLKYKRGTSEYDEWFLNYKPTKGKISIDDTPNNETPKKKAKSRAKKKKQTTVRRLFGILGRGTRKLRY
jgi:hypothetical protein